MSCAPCEFHCARGATFFAFLSADQHHVQKKSGKYEERNLKSDISHFKGVRERHTLKFIPLLLGRNG
jgi:hypothetical protein